MILLGMTNYPVVSNVVARGAVELDYLEVHGPFVKTVRLDNPTTPMLLHNSLYQWSLTHPNGLEHKDAANLTVERLELARSPWYSLHLGFSCAEVDFVGESMAPLSPLQPRELVMERSVIVLNQISSLLNMPVLIENLDYNPTGAYEYICEPAFITKILEQTDTYLLLDLAHARVSANAFSMSVEEYIRLLPLDKVRQIHLNRPGWDNGRMVDAHLDLQEDDYQLLADTLHRCHPWSVTLEYNRDETLIPPQIERLREICRPAK
ncbi:MAG: hypothetical protein CVU39_27275 [Chloroflexi bacterium HGW-Chloroflexi-10]|nr:MAG: hypothetical protein CVU39_27275 [Chloroflexi bacterium HGW-Chloroflexi-10]